MSDIRSFADQYRILKGVLNGGDLDTISQELQDGSGIISDEAFDLIGDFAKDVETEPPITRQLRRQVRDDGDTVKNSKSRKQSITDFCRGLEIIAGSVSHGLLLGDIRDFRQEYHLLPKASPLQYLPDATLVSKMEDIVMKRKEACATSYAACPDITSDLNMTSCVPNALRRMPILTDARAHKSGEEFRAKEIRAPDDSPLGLLEGLARR